MQCSPSGLSVQWFVFLKHSYFFDVACQPGRKGLHEYTKKGGHREVRDLTRDYADNYCV